MVCKKCGADIQEGTKFCMMCGEKIDSQNVCADCGAIFDAKARFCPMCGKPVSTGTAPAAFVPALSSDLDEFLELGLECEILHDSVYTLYRSKYSEAAEKYYPELPKAPADYLEALYRDKKQTALELYTVFNNNTGKRVFIKWQNWQLCPPIVLNNRYLLLEDFLLIGGKAFFNCSFSVYNLETRKTILSDVSFSTFGDNLYSILNSYVVCSKCNYREKQGDFFSKPNVVLSFSSIADRTFNDRKELDEYNKKPENTVTFFSANGKISRSDSKITYWVWENDLMRLNDYIYKDGHITTATYTFLDSFGNERFTLPDRGWIPTICNDDYSYGPLLIKLVDTSGDYIIYSIDANYNIKRVMDFDGVYDNTVMRYEENKSYTFIAPVNILDDEGRNDHAVLYLLDSNMKVIKKLGIEYDRYRNHDTGIEYVKFDYYKGIPLFLFYDIKAINNRTFCVMDMRNGNIISGINLYDDSIVFDEYQSSSLENYVTHTDEGKIVLNVLFEKTIDGKTAYSIINSKQVVVPFTTARICRSDECSEFREKCKLPAESFVTISYKESSTWGLVPYYGLYDKKGNLLIQEGTPEDTFIKLVNELK